MTAVRDINASIADSHDRRWDQAIRRSEIAARNTRSVVVSAWDQLTTSIRESVATERTANQAVAEAYLILSPLQDDLWSSIEGNLRKQIAWSYRTEMDALFGWATEEELATVADWIEANRLTEARQKIGLRGMRRIIDPPDEARIQEILFAEVAGSTWEQRLDELSHQVTGGKQSVLKRIAAGIAAGERPAEIRDAIQPLVNNLQVSATRIVRTEMRRVTNQISEDVWAKSEKIIVGYTRRSQRDDRVRPEHVIRDGDYYAANDTRRPSLPDAPNCRCYYVPKWDVITKEMRRELELMTQPKPGDAKPATPTGTEPEVAAELPPKGLIGRTIDAAKRAAAKAKARVEDLARRAKRRIGGFKAAVSRRFRGRTQEVARIQSEEAAKQAAAENAAKQAAEKAERLDAPPPDSVSSGVTPEEKTSIIQRSIKENPDILKPVEPSSVGRFEPSPSGIHPSRGKTYEVEGRLWSRREGSATDSELIVVLAKADKLEAYWGSSDPGLYLKPRGGGGQISGRLEAFQKFLDKPESGTAALPIEMPRLQIGTDGELTIEDGRHRTRFFLDKGAKLIPVLVDPDNARLVKVLLGG